MVQVIEGWDENLAFFGRQIYYMQFLSRVSILTRDIDIANLPVCPSIRTMRCQSAATFEIGYESDSSKWRYSKCPYLYLLPL